MQTLCRGITLGVLLVPSLAACDSEAPREHRTTSGAEDVLRDWQSLVTDGDRAACALETERFATKMNDVYIAWASGGGTLTCTARVRQNAAQLGTSAKELLAEDKFEVLAKSGRAATIEVTHAYSAEFVVRSGNTQTSEQAPTSEVYTLIRTGDQWLIDSWSGTAPANTDDLLSN